MKYPHVLGEAETLARVCAGASIARYGDGEFNLCRSGSAKAQKPDAQLASKLREILHKSGDCLVGIPNIKSETPKAEFWQKYLATTDLLTKRPYVSAFITRPDSAPWIDDAVYWDALESLWVGQKVTLVRGSGRSLMAADLVGATVTEVIGPERDAWADYQRVMAAILATRPTRVLLCLGPTATVMAVHLCALGIQAIDIGHVGMFLRKHRRGEPMTVTDADKVAR